MLFAEVHRFPCSSFKLGFLNTEPALFLFSGCEEFRLSQRPIQFQCEVFPSVPQRFCSDSTFINQILINLLNNAFKFTEAGTISCSAEAKLIDQQQWIEFIVKDTGIGISPERLPFIFERFNQAGKANKVQRDGTGLGPPADAETPSGVSRETPEGVSLWDPEEYRL